MKTKLAIVGFSEKSRDFAPYDDPEWEIWGCNHVYRFVPRVDALFELHRIPELEAKYGPEKWPVYSEYLRGFGGALWMQEQSEQFPNAKRMPIEVLEQEFGYQLERVEYEGVDVGKRRVTKRELEETAQFKSTLSYMLAMALLEKRFKVIGVYGVDMRDDSEWHFQRMNFSFFLGWARGMGVDLVIPDNSALLQEAGFRLYGYESGTAEKYKAIIDNRGKRVKDLDGKLVEMDEENERMCNRIHEIRGAIKLADEFAASSNGNAQVFLDRKAQLQRDLNEVFEKQRVHLLNMCELKGRRYESYELMDQLGYHNRGEMPEGRA